MMRIEEPAREEGGAEVKGICTGSGVPARRSGAGWGWFVPFAVLWADLIRQLSYTWSTSQQYAYGWFVPFFVVALFWRRWADGPSIERRSDGPASGKMVWVVWAVGLILCVALLPLRIIHETNEDWPLITWPLTLCVVALTMGVLVLWGGWRWARHFLFPVSFILLAVRWPWTIEHLCTQGLMRLDAGLTVEVLDWLGIPAMQQGNLIELSTTTVGVDEACSGIRSFQSTLMASLLMGELYRLRMWPRVMLVVVGLALAFAFNVARTLILSYQTAQGGAAALEKWHDPAGFTIAVITFVSVWLLALLVRRKWSVPQAVPDGAAGEKGAGKQDRPEGIRWSSRFAFVVGTWGVLSVGLTEVWYRSHESQKNAFLRWSVGMPETKPGFAKIVLPERTLDLLNCDAVNAARWQDDGGAEWTVYFLRWEARTRRSLFGSRGHRPEVCLPAAGLKQISAPTLDRLELSGLNLTFQKSAYSSGATPLHVFWVLWQDGDEGRTGVRSVNNSIDRMIGPKEGRRVFGQQTLEVIVSGYDNAEAAERAVRDRLPTMIRIESGRGETAAKTLSE